MKTVVHSSIFVLERDDMLVFKKKVSDNQLANVFLNGVLDVVELGFPEIASLINDDPAFVQSPNIGPENSDQFAVIILVANLSSLENTFEVQQASRIEAIIFEKLAVIMQATPGEVENTVREYQKFLSRVNHPSKNMIYAISKAIFHKYELNAYQDEYFKRLHAPNPLFLKRMDQVVDQFLWDWDAFFKKYRIEE